MSRLLLALVSAVCALFRIDSDSIARQQGAARTMAPDSFGH